MTGWLQIEYTSSSPVSGAKLAEIREDISKNYVFEWKKDIITDLLAYTINTNSIRLEIGLLQEENVAKLQKITTNIREVIPTFFEKNGISVSEASFVSVGQSFGKFVMDRAYLTLTMCLIAIALYLMYAFRHSIEGTSSFTFWAITLATLLHDVIIAPGIYIFLGTIFPALKVDTFFVTALLTILGYSISDTIVILDRIRAFYRDKKTHANKTTKQIFNDAICVSFRRSVYTSMTLVMVLVCMLLFWPQALIGFTTLMLLGTVVGTYSSICIATPVLYDINASKK